MSYFMEQLQFEKTVEHGEFSKVLTLLITKIRTNIFEIPQTIKTAKNKFGHTVGAFVLHAPSIDCIK